MKKKLIDLLLVQEKGKRHYVLIKDFHAFMYNHILHCSKTHFCRYCLQGFSTEEILKCHIKDCFKVNGRQKTIMLKMVDMLNSKIIKEK